MSDLADGGYLEVTSESVGSYKVDWFGTTNIVQDPGIITGLSITYRGHYSSHVTQSVYVYNWDSATWELKDTRTVFTTDDTVNWNTATPEDYISPTGEIRLRVEATALWGFYCYGDLMQFEVSW